MTDFYSQNRCVCSTRSHGPLLCAFCLSFHFNCLNTEGIPAHSEKYTVRGSIARAARVVTSIYIVANGNDHVMQNNKHSQ